MYTEKYEKIHLSMMAISSLGTTESYYLTTHHGSFISVMDIYKFGGVLIAILDR